MTRCIQPGYSETGSEKREKTSLSILRRFKNDFRAHHSAGNPAATQSLKACFTSADTRGSGGSSSSGGMESRPISFATFSDQNFSPSYVSSTGRFLGLPVKWHRTQFSPTSVVLSEA